MHVEQLIEHYGYPVILVGTLLEGQPVMLFGGFAAHRGYLDLLPWVILAGATMLVAPSAAPAAEQVPIPLTTSEVSGPAAGNTMTADYVQMVGRMAYAWGYAMVNAHNRHAAFAEAPEPGLLGGVVPMAPVGKGEFQ